MKKETAVMLLCGIFGVSFCDGKQKDARTFFRDTHKVMDVTDFSIFYDLNTNETIRKMMPRPWYRPGWLLRLPFTGGKCKCDRLQCNCCTGVRIEAFNFDRRTCAVLSYEPVESLINLEVRMNNDTVLKSTYSARNPPPFCVPIPVPYLPPGFVDMCVRLFDVNIVDQRLHVCMDMDTRIDMAPVLVLHFDCMDMGLSGVSLSKPSGTSPNLSTDGVTDIAAVTTSGQLDADVFDPVDYEKANATAPDNKIN